MISLSVVFSCVFIVLVVLGWKLHEKHKFYKVLSSEKSCDTLSEGKWLNFEREGFWKRYGFDVISKNITNITSAGLDSVYFNGFKPPKYSNGFYKWNEQNYSGIWESSCSRIQPNCINDLFQDSKKTTPVLALNGDSITRQIYLAFEMYTNNRKTGFFDYGFQNGRFQKQKPELIFYWDDGVRKLDVKIFNRDKITINDRMDRTQHMNSGEIEKEMYNLTNAKILIVGPKFLHPVAKIQLVKSVKLHNIPAINYFERIELPKIKYFLGRNPKAKVYVLGQHFVHRHDKTFIMMRLIKEYNRMLKKVVYRALNKNHINPNTTTPNFECMV